tara:strand:+ start:537 stop:698 length:162 start_codon:yes stop_codon:yes gene_type:complete
MTTLTNEGKLIYFDGVDGYNALSDEDKKSIANAPDMRPTRNLNTQIEDLRRGK